MFLFDVKLYANKFGQTRLALHIDVVEVFRHSITGEQIILYVYFHASEILHLIGFLITTHSIFALMCSQNFCSMNF
jgi:hypothetical protein